MPILLVFMSLSFENSDALSANMFHIDFKPSGKSFYKLKTTKDLKPSLRLFLLVFLFYSFSEQVAANGNSPETCLFFLFPYH